MRASLLIVRGHLRCRFARLDLNGSSNKSARTLFKETLVGLAFHKNALQSCFRYAAPIFHRSRALPIFRAQIFHSPSFSPRRANPAWGCRSRGMWSHFLLSKTGDIFPPPS